jgi:hypothetical protein
MSKVLSTQNLKGHRTTSVLAAFSLTISIAAFGCTTDRHLGNGDPVTTPDMRTSPTGGLATGSETGSVNQPMTSSSRFDAPVRTGRIHRLSAADAAAVVAANQPRVRVLGPASPGQHYASNRVSAAAPGYAINATDPALLISADTGALVAGGTATNMAATSTNSGSVIVGTNGIASLSPTGAAIPLSAGTFAMGTGTFTPTAASVVNPPASISGMAAVPAVTTAQVPGVTASSTVSTAAPAVAAQNAVAQNAAQNAMATATVTSAAAGAIANPVRLVTGANGRSVMTNSAPRAKNSGSQ